MAIIKPLQLGLIGRAQREPPKVYFFVTALGYFDLLDPADFDLETRMWPAVTPTLGASPLDPGMPKPRGEVVVIGDAVAPGARPVTQMAVEFSVGPVRKALAVFGDRHWEPTDDGPVFTAPAPFERMPVVWERAFGGPGFPEWGHLPIPARLLRQGIDDIVRISDARMSGTSFGTDVLHVSPEAAVGGPLAAVRTGDVIELDVPARRIQLLVDDNEIRGRLAAYRPPPAPYRRGYGRLFLREVTQAHEGCDFRFLERLPEDQAAGGFDAGRLP